MWTTILRPLEYELHEFRDFVLFTAVPQMPRTVSDTQNILNDVMTDYSVRAYMCMCYSDQIYVVMLFLRLNHRYCRH